MASKAKWIDQIPGELLQIVNSMFTDLDGHSKLPAGAHVTDGTIGQLLDGADALLQNDAYWQSLPKKICNTKEQVSKRRRELAAERRGIRAAGAGHPLLGLVLDSFTEEAALELKLMSEGIERVAAREYLRELLDSVRAP